MGPKVEAACRFADATGNVAAIGALKDLPAILSYRPPRNREDRWEWAWHAPIEGFAIGVTMYMQVTCQ